MAERKIRMNAKLKNGVTEVKAIITHPMESGFRKNKETNETIPAHHVQEFTLYLNDNPVATGYLGGGVSKDPYLSFRIKGGASGDVVKMAWSDNQGESGSKEKKIK